MPPGEDASVHGAGVVIELHLHEGRTHPRHLAGALLGARAEPRNAPGQPSQQPETGETKRDCDIEPAARAEQQRQQDEAEDERHYDLICSRSLRAPAWWRAERSASARIPPAA